MKKSRLILFLSSLSWIALLLPSLTLGSPVEPGFDLLATPENVNSHVDLPSIGRVYLKGNTGPLTSEKLGSTDTIVQRKQGINPFEQGNSGTVDTELVALSLKSVSSFDGSSLGIPGMVDLYVVVNALDLPDLPSTNGKIEPSTGKMTITHDYKDGGIHPTYGGQVEGTFTASFPAIHAFLIFVKAGGKLSKPADWVHSMKADPIKLESKGWWSHQQPLNDYHNGKYSAGKFYIVSPGRKPIIIEKTGLIKWGPKIEAIIHTGPHPPRPSNPVTFEEPLTATTLEEHGVRLTWTTTVEESMAGFAIYRGELRDNEGECTDDVDDYTTITMIAWENSQGDITTAANYTVMDSDGNGDVCYGLAAIGFDGTVEEVQTTKVK